MTDDRDVYVKSSPIHGLGVFARRTFATGETVLSREGRLVTADNPLDPTRGEAEQHCIAIARGQLIYLDFPTRFVNHSCDPNAFVAERDGRRQVVALRPIHPHEEVLVHYGIDLCGIIDWNCQCGSDRCLGVIPGSFFEMPLDTQIELSPFLSAWFIEENAEAYRALMVEAGMEDELD